MEAEAVKRPLLVATTSSLYSSLLRKFNFHKIYQTTLTNIFFFLFDKFIILVSLKKVFAKTKVLMTRRYPLRRYVLAVTPIIHLYK